MKSHLDRLRQRLLPVDAIVAAIVVGILYASLVRYGEIDCRLFHGAFLRMSARMSRSDVFGNVVAYVLLGAAIGFAWAQRFGPRRPRLAQVVHGGLWTVAACTLLSLSMEAAQACMTTRDSSARDVLANAAGGALGWVVSRAVHPAWTAITRRGEGRARRARLLAVVAAASALWWVSATAPWLPRPEGSLAWEHLRQQWVALNTSPFDPWRLARWSGEWLALGLLMSLPLRRGSLAVVPLAGLAAATLGLRVFLPGTDPSPTEALASLPFALAMVALLPLLGERAVATVALAAATTAVLAYQLEPGYGPLRAFAWKVVILRGNALQAIPPAAWAAWAAATLVTAGHVLGGRAIAWAALPALLFAATEWAQTLIPGRTPDLSPTLVAGVAAVAAVGMLAGSSSARARARATGLRGT